MRNSKFRGVALAGAVVLVAAWNGASAADDLPACPHDAAGRWAAPVGGYTGAWQVALQCQGTNVTGRVSMPDSRACRTGFPVTGTVDSTGLTLNSGASPCGGWSGKIGRTGGSWDNNFVFNSSMFGAVRISDLSYR